ncbi:T9SS type A sorting domain-containing protein [Pedobacter sp.]|uniref:T9SS type A sorting domain-containing protein n=1 Tax=Pedobacter sp. TaxID=1411316 RepID=UPI003D7FDABE
MSVFGSDQVFAQRMDSINYSMTQKKTTKVNNTPQIRTNIKSYRPYFGFIPYNTFLTSASTATSIKYDKILTVLKVYPNPVEDQINIMLRLERESLLSIKIMDLLGNEVITLANERFPSGEITKSYTFPTRLNSGIYFLRIVAGAETSVKRISVL